MISQEVQKYNVAVEQKANKDRQAAAAAEALASAEARKKQEYLSSAEALSSQLKRLDTLIKQVETSLDKWTRAKTGKSSDYYRELERECEALKQMRSDIASTGKALGDFDSRVGKSTATIRKISTVIKDAGEDTKSLTDRFSGLASKFGAWLTVSQAVMTAVRAVKDMVRNVVEIDSAMTELKKVTDETDAVYSKFLNNASIRAKAVGASLSDVVNATADFARLGYGIEEASNLADVAIIYKNIGDGIQDIATASESIISTMQAFGIEASNAMSIVDKFNEVGNKYAISSAGIGEAMQRSASAMKAANNTIEETIALITAANTIVQNPESVGTTLKTVSMYLRAAKTEAEEAGESTDGMAGSISELRESILKLTGQKVDIQIDDDTFKSTYQILKELSAVWDSLTDVSRANILEMVGGKRNSNVVSALLENFSVAERAFQTASNSAGSALAENEKHLDSISGKINKFESAWQSLSVTIVSSGITKAIIDIGTGMATAADAIVGFVGATGGFASIIPILTAIEAKFGIFKTLFNSLNSGATKLVGGENKRYPLKYAHRIVMVTLNEL